MNKVLLFSHDPGGANTIIPLVAPLRKKGYDLILCGNGPALDRYCQEGVHGFDLIERISEVTLESIANFLKRERPDFLITGTSAEDFTEKFLWQAATELSIPSFAILDQWLNYGIRFSPFGLSNSEDYESAPEHRYLPSRIIVMDSDTQEEMARIGIMPREQILPLGQPHFEALQEKARALPLPGELRKRHGFSSDEFIVTYVSEPLSIDYGDDPDNGCFWGFTERTIFRELRKSLASAARQTGRQVRLIIKHHPRETTHNYDGLLDSTEPLMTISRDRTTGSLEMIQTSDLVCGISSMMLIEAAIIGKPVFSILIGLKRESPFILDRRGILRSLRNQTELEESLIKKLKGETDVPVKFEVDRNPVQAIIEEMERMLS